MAPTPARGSGGRALTYASDCTRSWTARQPRCYANKKESARRRERARAGGHVPSPSSPRHLPPLPLAPVRVLPPLPVRFELSPLTYWSRLSAPSVPLNASFPITIPRDKMNCSGGYANCFLQVPLACLGSMAQGSPAGTLVEL